MKIDVLLGLQWGDEGKGKIVDVLTPQYEVIARFQGGANAGHTLEFNGQKHILHLIPSGIFHEKTENIIGNGVIVDPFILEKEINGLKASGFDPTRNLLLSLKTHLILPTHRLLDACYEFLKGKEKIGSTLKGIGPTYTDKTARKGIRVGDLFKQDFQERYKQLKATHLQIIEANGFDASAITLEDIPWQAYEKQWFDALETIKSLRIINCEYYLNQKLREGKKILAEGAQGTLLDVDYGFYPFVTSSSTVASGVCTGLGVAPSSIGRVYGIAKAYCTRVGSGPFPTELHDATGQKLREQGHEFGSTTGRPRRCGWIDLPLLKYAVMLNGVTDLILTKADVLGGFEEISACTGYTYKGCTTDEIPFDICDKAVEPHYIQLKGWEQGLERVKNYRDTNPNLQAYIRYIEEAIGVPVAIVSVGPDREQTLKR
ncbi:MAG: adenylosuccinate synthase [Bacteroidetes bacterium]|nr:MAG: adenylosuccinate synthase [Bacteroidota bacterium]PIE87738.1 MAG: adenylosuccinate synthase [Bacteroidota bacterium]